MHYPLMDITDRISEDPIWWLDGIPRYCDYHPHEATFQSTNLLVRVWCQGCGSTFDVAVGTSATLEKGIIDPVSGYPIDSKTGLIIRNVDDDPPFHLGKDGFNCIGNSMLEEWVAILQVWEGQGQNYSRRPDLEGPSPNSPI